MQADSEHYAGMIKAWKEYTIQVPDTQADQVISGVAKMKYKGSQDATASQLYVDYGKKHIRFRP
ncbi:Multicopper oxidase type 2 [Penicillium fimorum]|uniref:Multicopper oxidase type 2 n=1 Tax=Penicillium fimorum TaxID=1882269 RepID=A0A9W9XXP7_9EURO|nr:Multicopper oxidase type 2 [Penicillium fimorum]